MTKILIILVIAFTFEAFGVITLKRGLDQIGPRYTERKAALPLWKNVLKLLGDWFTNKNILLFSLCSHFTLPNTPPVSLVG